MRRRQGRSFHRLPARISAAGAALVVLTTSGLAAPIPLLSFSRFASSCAPHVAVETLASVARTESGFDVLTLHDNSSGRTYHPSTRDDAIALGVELTTVDEHSVDFGLMQINSANFSTLGLSVSEAFDPCLNLGAADRLLVDGYSPPGVGRDTQPAVEQALSRYNTGDSARGMANGYVRRVEASAELVVPALRVKGDLAPAQSTLHGGEEPVVTEPLPPLPPIWDVYARAKANHGQVFGSSPASAAVAALPPAALPARAKSAAPSSTKIEAMNDAR